ncbi:MAG: phosphoribosylformylglycinamidine synthase subunit PurS [Acidobacteriota bacterium]
MPAFRARVIVVPRADLLDPQGKAIRAALARLDFEGVTDVRAGKSFDVHLEADDAPSARHALEHMARALLVNDVTEDFEIVAVDAIDAEMAP